MARQHEQAVDIIDDPVAADGSLANATDAIEHVADVEPRANIDAGGGHVQNMNIRLVIDIGNNKTIQIPLRGKLILQQNGGGGDGGGDAQPTTDDDGVPDANKKDPGGCDDDDGQGLRGLGREEHGWLMTVAALFVQMAFQAALQPPTWIPADWFRPLHLHGKSAAAAATAAAAAAATSRVTSAAVSPSSHESPATAAAAGITKGQAIRAWGYICSNTLTFATALTLVVTLLLAQGSLPAHTIKSVTIMLVMLAFTCAATIVMSYSFDADIMVLVIGVIVMYAIFAVYNLSVLRNCYARQEKSEAGAQRAKSEDAVDSTKAT